jgi:hypothetical protein
LKNSGWQVIANEIQGRFRIANWGSSPNGWEDGVDANTIWQTIPGGAVSNAAVINNGTKATDANGLTFNWIVSGADLTAFQNGTRLAHQCMLLELTSSGPAPLPFVNKSTWTNMNFAHASEFTEKAQITLKGLTPIAPDGRDVYVWVEKLNMPTQVGSSRPAMLETSIPGHFVPPPPPNPNGATGGYSLVYPSGQEYTPPPMITGVTWQPGMYVPSQPGKSIPIPGMEELMRMVAAGEVTQQQLEDAVPTYIVHVYHDTGKRLSLDGSDRPVVIAQGSFGYYVSHEGDLYGWQDKLVPEGFALEQVSENFYKITKMPNDGVLTVGVEINALETAPTMVGKHHSIVVFLLILIILLLILLLIMRRRRR